MASAATFLGLQGSNRSLLPFEQDTTMTCTLTAIINKLWSGLGFKHIRYGMQCSSTTNIPLITPSKIFEQKPLAETPLLKSMARQQECTGSDSPIKAGVRVVPPLLQTRGAEVELVWRVDRRVKEPATVNPPFEAFEGWHARCNLPPTDRLSPQMLIGPGNPVMIALMK